MDTSPRDFDEWFDEMAALAQESPKDFEKMRQELIEQTINQATPSCQEKLRKLQWRIDMERKRAKTPLGACIRIYDMLLEMVYGEGGFLDSIKMLERIAADLKYGRSVNLKKAPSQTPKKAQIISFPGKKN